MAEFNLSLQKTLAHEGGYSNDPDDSGKETYRGISRANHVRWTGWKIIDQLKSDSDFPSNLLHNTGLQKQVEMFYHTNFWLPLNVDQISNQIIADSIFDFGVNAGLKTSVRMIQAIVGTRTDGILGELTLQKLNSLDFNYVLASFTVGKLEYYIYCVKKRPVNMKYLYGWVIRALSFND